MRELTKDEIAILQRHAKWLQSDGEEGERADLSNSDLSNAKLDFSCWPLWCGSRDVKADDRLVAQLLFHVTRLDVTQCSGGVREAMGNIRTMAVSDLFCEYRNGIEKIGE